MLQAGGIFALLAGVCAPFWPLGGFAALFAAAIIVLFSLGSRRERALALAALLLLFWAGRQSLPDTVKSKIPLEEERRWSGVVTKTPRPTDGGFSVEVELRESAPPQPSGGYSPLSGRVSLSVEGVLPGLPAEGDAVFWRGPLHAPVGMKNPGGEWRAFYFARQGIAARGGANYPGEVFFAAPAAGGFLRNTRLTLARAMEQVAGPGEGAVLRALVLGDFSAVDRQTLERFRLCGTTHLLAVSGFHLGVVAFGAIFIFSSAWARVPYLALRFPAPLAARVCAAPLLVFYALLTGSQVATLRALFMTLLLLFSALMRRKVSFFNLTASAVLLLGALDPRYLFDPALHLSVSALAGVFWLAPALAPREAATDAKEKLAEKKSRAAKAAKWLSRKTGELLLVSFCATVAAMPVSAYYFGGTSWMGLLANPVGVPVIGAFSLPLGVAGSFLYPFWEWGAGLCWAAAGWGIGFLLKIQETLAPYAGFVSVPFGKLPAVAGVWLLIFALVAYRGGEVGARKKGVVAVILGAVLLFAPPLFSALWSASAKKGVFYLFDVGNGQCAAASLPREGFKSPLWALVDGGGFPSSSYDVGKNQIAPALRELGCARLDLVISSHPHPDHLSGLVTLVREFRPRLLLLPLAFQGDWRYGDLLRTARETQTPVGFVGPEGFYAEGGGVRVLSSGGPEENDRSLAVIFESGGGRVLVSGDLEKGGQEGLLKILPAGQFDIATAPHHGLPDAVYPPFWEKVRPAKIFVSSAKKRTALPEKLLVDASSLGAELFCTGDGGCLRGEFGGGE